MLQMERQDTNLFNVSKLRLKVKVICWVMLVELTSINKSQEPELLLSWQTNRLKLLSHIDKKLNLNIIDHIYSSWYIHTCLTSGMIPFSPASPHSSHTHIKALLHGFHKSFLPFRFLIDNDQAVPSKRHIYSLGSSTKCFCRNTNYQSCVSLYNTVNWLCGWEEHWIYFYFIVSLHVWHIPPADNGF